VDGAVDGTGVPDGAAVPGGQPSERTDRSLRDVAELRTAGAQVLLLTADVGEPGQLRAALAEARQHLGAVDVIVHAAGVPGGGMAQRSTPAAAARVLAPKVHAMRPLAELLDADPAAGPQPRLLILYSSVATVIGGLGESAYCAANTALNAYGTALAAVGKTQVISVAWGQWQHDDWPTELTGQALSSRVAYRERYGFSDEDGCLLLGKLVGGGVRGTVVALRQRLPEAIRTWSGYNDLDDLLTTSAARSAQARFPRPTLRVDYAPPRTGLESTIAQAWADYLGIDRVGVNDPFFDLGGNSLVGTAMVASLERTLSRRIAPAVLFQHPTVAAFAAALSDAEGSAEAPQAAASRGERRRRASFKTTASAQRGHHD
jgi:NAD(P)-dependent dehydrogenase (short-subunit alcohol dehydrogenase family)